MYNVLYNYEHTLINCGSLSFLFLWIFFLRQFVLHATISFRPPSGGNKKSKIYHVTWRTENLVETSVQFDYETKRNVPTRIGRKLSKETLTFGWDCCKKVAVVNK